MYRAFQHDSVVSIIRVLLSRHLYFTEHDIVEPCSCRDQTWLISCENSHDVYWVNELLSREIGSNKGLANCEFNYGYGGYHKRMCFDMQLLSNIIETVFC